MRPQLIKKIISCSFLIQLIILLNLFSCTGNKQEGTQESSLPSDNYINVPADISMTESNEEAELVTINENNFKKIRAKNPVVFPTNSHIIKAKEPKAVNPVQPTIIKIYEDKTFQPETVTVRSELLSVKWTPAVNALPAAKNDNAIYDISSISVEQGMNSAYVRDLAEDKQGNLWIGTEGGGLSKYDGHSFIQFTQHTGLPNNHVETVLSDHAGNIWLSNLGMGVVLYDGNNFHHFKPGRGIKGHFISCIMEDKKGNIWFGSEAGVSKYAAGQSALAGTEGKKITGPEKKITNYRIGYNNSDNVITALMEDKHGTMWFGSKSGSLSKFDGQLITRLNTDSIFSGHTILSIIEDTGGIIWLCVDNVGLVKYDGNSFRIFGEAEGLVNNFVNDALEDKSGNIWISSYGGGVCKLDPSVNEFTYLTEKNGLNSKYVVKISEDHTGNLWFATLGGGLCMFKDNSFSHFSENEGLSNSLVWNIIKDKSDNLWIGTNNGLCKYNGKSFSQYFEKQGLPSRYVWCLQEDSKGRIWIGTVNGLYVFDGTHFIHYSGKEGLPQMAIKCILGDKDENIWIGSTRGLFRFNGLQRTFFTQKNGLPGSVVNCIEQDNRRNLWIGTNKGLVKFDGKRFFQFLATKGKNIHEVYSLKKDSAGNLWLGTGTGIIKLTLTLNPGEKEFFTFYSDKQNNESSIESLLITNPSPDKLIIFGGTMKGLIALEIEKNKIIASGEKIKWRIFSRTEGLKSIRFYSNASLLDNNGNAWWGTEKSLTSLNLNSFRFDGKAPVLELNEILLKENFIDFRNTNDTSTLSGINKKHLKIKFSGVASFNNYPTGLTLPYKTNHITFRFSAHDWNVPNKIMYQYMMQGLDNKWSQLRESNTADFRNLPFGKFIFKVRAINTAGIYSNEFVYAFTITPPWWHTWWFRSIAVVLIIYFLFSLYRYRTAMLRQRQKFLIQTVEQRTTELRISLEEKEGLLKEIHHRVKNNLEIISSLLMLQTKNITDEKAKAALAEGQSRVQSIALIHHKLYRNDDLAMMEMKGFATDLYKQVSDVCKRPGDSCKFTITGTELLLNTDASVPVGLILNELFTNSFKYALQREKENIISIKLEEHFTGNEVTCRIIYRDNGNGMPADFKIEQSTSLGMKIIQLLTRQLNGSFNYYNDKGAVFEINFPKTAGKHTFIQKK